MAKEHKVEPKVDPREEKIIERGNTPLKNHVVAYPKLNGVARTVRCIDNMGNNNFQILTCYIENGVVVKMDVSDSYANFEVISRLELANEMGIISLNNNWNHGEVNNK